MELRQETKIKTLEISVDEIKNAKDYFKEFVRPLNNIVYLVGLRAPEISPMGLTLNDKMQEAIQADLNRNFGLMVLQDTDFPTCKVKAGEFVHIRPNTEAVISRVYTSEDKWDITLPELDKTIVNNPQRHNKALEALKKKYIFLGIEYFNLTSVVEPRNITI